MVYQYRCNQGHVTDDFVRSYKHRKDTVPCETCGDEAFQIISVTQRPHMNSWKTGVKEFPRTADEEYDY